MALSHIHIYNRAANCASGCAAARHGVQMQTRKNVKRKLGQLRRGVRSMNDAWRMAQKRIVNARRRVR
jgi:hypothetical protein